MKFFDSLKDIVDLAEDKFSDSGLLQLGIILKVMSVTKAKDILKVARANAKTEFMTKNSDIVTLEVYEEAYDRLSDEFKEKLMEGVLSNVSYDTEKEKLNVDTSRYGEFVRMRRKYANYGDIIETATTVIEEIAEEEKQRKEEERARKAEEKAARKRNN